MTLLCVGCKNPLPPSPFRHDKPKYPCCGARECAAEGRRLGKQEKARAKAANKPRKVVKPCICGRPGSHSYVCSMARQGKSVTRDPRIVAFAERKGLAA